MPAEGFNFQALVRRLGMKNVDELPVVHAITPTLIVGDAVAQGLVNPLRGAEAWFGNEQAPIAAEHGAFQIRALTRDIVATIYYGSDVAAFYHFRIDPGAGSILAADPLVTLPVGTAVQTSGPIPTTAILSIGTTTVAPATLTPTFAGATGTPASPIPDVFIPIGSQLTFSIDDVNTLFLFSIHWKEFVSPDLQPPE